MACTAPNGRTSGKVRPTEASPWKPVTSCSQRAAHGEGLAGRLQPQGVSLLRVYPHGSQSPTCLSTRTMATIRIAMGTRQTRPRKMQTTTTWRRSSPIFVLRITVVANNGDDGLRVGAWARRALEVWCVAYNFPMQASFPIGCIQGNTRTSWRGSFNGVAITIMSFFRAAVGDFEYSVEHVRGYVRTVEWTHLLIEAMGSTRERVIFLDGLHPRLGAV